MTAESTHTAPRSRRALLAGAIGGLGVWAASAIGRAAPAEAAAGDPSGWLSTRRRHDYDSPGELQPPLLRAVQIGAGNGLHGDATSGRAIMGVGGTKGTALWGYSPNHIGVSPRPRRATASKRALGRGSIGIYPPWKNSRANFANGPNDSRACRRLQDAAVDRFRRSGSTSRGSTLFARDNGAGKTSSA